MNDLLKNTDYIINKLLRRDARKEAKLILLLTTDKHRKEFINYYNDNKENICCMVLDTAKQELVSQKLLTQKETDSFGKIYF
jgi:hypothetical protein